jgi:ribonuclease HI
MPPSRLVGKKILVSALALGRSMSSKKNFYAVRVGRVPGIYTSWNDCKAQTNGFSGSVFKGFAILAEAEAWFHGPSEEIPSASANNAKSSSPSRSRSPRSSSSTSTTASSSNATKAASKTKTSTKTKTKTKTKIATSERTPTSSESAVVVYCDGSCLGNGQEGSVAGVGVWFGDNHPMNVSEPLEGEKQTNQRAELTAAIRAVEQADAQYGREATLEIRTDSKYTIGCVTEWIPRWRCNKWKTASGQPVSNVDLITCLDQLCASRPGRITWTHVFGHTGEYGNTNADKLSVLGAERNAEIMRQRKMDGNMDDSAANNPRAKRLKANVN